MNDYYNAIHKCCERYRDMIIDREYWDGALAHDELYRFVMKTMFHARDKDLPLMKLNRWLGYIQGCLIEKGITTVEAERDWTRPLFRPLDFPEKPKEKRCKHLKKGEVCQLHNLHCGWPKCAIEVDD